MAALKFKGDHNKVAFLGSAKGHEVFEPMVEFLQRSKLRYALTHYPEVVYESLVTQFWETAEERSVEGNQRRLLLQLTVKSVWLQSPLLGLNFSWMMKMVNLMLPGRRLFRA